MPPPVARAAPRTEPPSPAAAAAPVPLDTLAAMPIAALRSLWKTHMGRAAPPASKRLLIRELAWRTQERRHGGLDAETRRLLHRAIRAAHRGDAAPDDTDPDHDQAPAPKRHPRGTRSAAVVTTAELPPGTRLVRTWGGQRHEVHALEAERGFIYRDRTYPTLSHVAREITGTRWSGPRFFGLTVRTAPKHKSEHA